jgi:hypothetical protein
MAAVLGQLLYSIPDGDRLPRLPDIPRKPWLDVYLTREQEEGKTVKEIDDLKYEIWRKIELAKEGERDLIRYSNHWVDVKKALKEERKAYREFLERQGLADV